MRFNELSAEQVTLVRSKIEQTLWEIGLRVEMAEVRDACAKVSLSEDHTSARVELTMTATASTLGESELEQALISELLPLLTRLSAAGCDALGLGRQAMMGAHDMARWRALDWPERYRSIRWEVAVGVNGPA